MMQQESRDAYGHLCLAFDAIENDTGAIVDADWLLPCVTYVDDASDEIYAEDPPGSREKYNEAMTLLLKEVVAAALELWRSTDDAEFDDFCKAACKRSRPRS